MLRITRHQRMLRLFFIAGGAVADLLMQYDVIIETFMLKSPAAIF